MNDEAFLNYVEMHSQTDRHAFHSDDCVRLGELADGLGAFYPDLLKLSTVEAWRKKVKE